MSDSAELSVVVAVGLEPVVTETAVAGLLVDLPDSVGVSYHHRDGTLRRTIGDRAGVIYDDVLPVEHCVSCTVRADLHATLAAVQRLGRFGVAVLAPPLTSAPSPIVHELLHAHHAGPPAQIAVRSVVAYADGAHLQHDLFGDDLVDERGLGLSAYDRRSVGEALTAQIEFADAVVAVTPAGHTETQVLHRMVGAGVAVHPDWTAFDPTGLLDRLHDYDQACDRIDPLALELTDRSDGSDPQPENGVWTLALESYRPLHPGRLMAGLEDLGTGRIRARGHFWLASRPQSACVWDAAGGQLSIGALGGWHGRQPGTRLLVTGVDPAERDRIRAVFAPLAVTGDELAGPIWPSSEDGFEPWLGDLALTP